MVVELILILSISVIFVALSVFFFFQNKKINLFIQKFVQETKGLNPIIYKDIQTSYITSQKYNSTFSVCNRSDIYLFDDFLVLFRRQHFIFKILFPPIVIISDINASKKYFSKQTDNPLSDILVSAILQNNFDAYKPKKISVSKFIVEITLPDRTNPSIEIVIAIKQITKEQISKLERIKDWC